MSAGCVALHTGGLCAIGDLHGDFGHALQALQMCGAVDEHGRWAAPPGTTIVQVGDVVDRGNASLALLQELWKLRDAASAAGSEFVTLMGNHELLNMRAHWTPRPTPRLPTRWTPRPTPRLPIIAAATS